MSDILQRIVATKLQEVEAAKTRISALAMQKDAGLRPCNRDFLAALRQKVANNHAAVIAETKKASPSKGVIREDFDPVDIAQSYAVGNGKKASATAACLSVLTDRDYFQGQADDLRLARASVDLPVLRKDFMVDAYQIDESRTWGADCVLLIAACLSDEHLRDFHARAVDLGMCVLLEVHDKTELERVLSLPLNPLVSIVGINNRNLNTFDVSLDTTLDLMPLVPKNLMLVTESGISTPADVARLRAAGVQGFLVGEAFMRAEDPGAALAELFA